MTRVLYASMGLRLGMAERDRQRRPASDQCCDHNGHGDARSFRVPLSISANHFQCVTHRFNSTFLAPCFVIPAARPISENEQPASRAAAMAARYSVSERRRDDAARFTRASSRLLIADSEEAADPIGTELAEAARIGYERADGARPHMHWAAVARADERHRAPSLAGILNLGANRELAGDACLLANAVDRHLAYLRASGIDNYGLPSGAAVVNKIPRTGHILERAPLVPPWNRQLRKQGRP
jgi:hypothetical protein